VGFPVRSGLVKLLIVLFLAIFLLYPIAYLFPRALADDDEPYAVSLLDAGARPEQVASALLQSGELDAVAAVRTVVAVPSRVKAELTLDAALSLARTMREAGGTVRIEGTRRFTAFYVAQVFANGFLWRCLLHSFAVAGLTTFVTTALALPLALQMTRYEFRGRGMLSAMLLVPLVLPPFVGAIGLRQIFGRFGTLNLALMNAGLIDQPIEWLGGGLWGVVVLEVLHLYPIMYLNVAAALSNLDPTLEEAARSLGAGERAVFRRITFPLMLPGYFAGAAIVFVWAFTDLGTPIVLGYRELVSFQIFERLSDADTNPVGYGLVLVTLGLTTGLYWLARRVAGSGAAMFARGGVGATMLRAGPGRTAAILTLAGTLTIVAMLPHVGVVLSAVADRWSFTALPSAYTFEHLEHALTHKLAGLSVRNSILYSLASTVLDIGLGVGIAYLVSRRPSWSSQALDRLAMLPLALPGLVLAFGLLTCFRGPADRVHRWADWCADRGVNVQRQPDGSEATTRAVWLAPARGAGHALEWLSRNMDPQKSPLLLLVVAYAVRRLPYMTRAALAGLEQTSVVFEEAAESLGASSGTTLRRITLPLISANIVAGAILTFSFAVLEVSDSIMLAQRENYFPITKAIYMLLARPDDGPNVGSALGVLGMLLLVVALGVASAVLGKRMGQLFRA
jgi:iron(III) transport system permease protein